MSKDIDGKEVAEKKTHEEKDKDMMDIEAHTKMPEKVPKKDSSSV